MIARAFAAVALLALAASVVVGQDPAKAYQESVGRPSLRKRVLGIERYAATKDVKAFEALRNRYTTTREENAEQVQYIIAEVLRLHFNEPQFVEAWAAWSAALKDPRDAWLRYNADLVLVKQGKAADVQASAKNEKLTVYFRAAAIEALSEHRHEGSLALATELLAALPKDKHERGVLIDACTSPMLAFAGQRAEEPVKVLARALAGKLDDKDVLDRTKLTVARALALCFEVDKVYMETGPWMDIIAGATPRKSNSKTDVKRPTFLGIEGAGKRILYVIDLSDSMLIPLTAKEKEDLKKGPVTGERRKPGEKPPEPKPEEKQPGPSEKDLPWDKINNRFEAAREFLKLSLRTLDKDMQFAIVMFGTYAETMKVTQGLIPASKGNIDRAIQALDAIKAGPKAENRPHGTLMDRTNLHGGMRLGFRTTAKGPIKSHEQVDPLGFDFGADTIFLLSDGAPSWDDFEKPDTRDPEDQAGDPETGAKVENTPTLIFFGPYVNPINHIIEDIRRMNLFRKAEIHSIGVGEANFGLLNEISKIGRGKMRQIG